MKHTKRKTSLKYLWDEDFAKHILDHMRGLQDAVNLVLTALQMYHTSNVILLRYSSSGGWATSNVSKKWEIRIFLQYSIKLISKVLPYIKRRTGDQPVVLARMMTRITGAGREVFCTRREWRSPKRTVQLLMLSVAPRVRKALTSCWK